MSKKTLEEASEYFAHNYFDMHDTNNYKALKFGFEKGAKWQAERMYSEEQVIAIVEKSRATGLTAEYIIQSLKQEGNQ